MKQLSFLTLIFAVLSLVFLLLLVFFRTSFPAYPLMSYQDAIDLLTPLVLILVYWLLFKYSSSEPASLTEEILFLLFAVFWVEGHGIHLAANSINNLIHALAERGGIDLTGSDLHTLTYFLDENLSHYVWHIGIVGLAALLIYREWRSPSGEETIWWATILGGLIYGFTYFVIFLEGQTVPLGLTFALLVVLFTLIWGRGKLASHPVLAFFFVSCLVALLLFAAWGLYWGGFPQFSDVGLI